LGKLGPPPGRSEPRPARIARVAAELAPLAFLAAVGAFLALGLPSVPERFAVHLTLVGDPDAWAERSALRAFGQVLAGAAVVLALLLARRGAMRRGDSGTARLAGGAALGGAYLAAASFGAAAARPLLASPGPWAVAVGVAMGFLFVPFLAVAGEERRAARGRRGVRLRPAARVHAAGGRVRWTLTLAAAAAGALLVLARIPWGR